ncbi:MAG: prepilin peptidase [Rhodospirillales bacterium]|nr:prepilin peptidase [Rhodospirillales bacterium]
MIFMIVFLFLLASVSGLGILSGVSDFKGLTIPNAYPLFIALAFFPAWAAVHFSGADMLAPLPVHLIAGGAIFVATFLMFLARAMGGGDAKLLSAYALWFGLKGLTVFLFYTALLGGVLGIVALFLKYRKPVKSPKEGGWIARVQAGESKVPYGIPIAAGAMLGFFLLGYVSPENLVQFLSQNN